MGLKTLVKVVNISNLSDARYCAGMGVEMLGYVVTSGHPQYIAPDLYQEIRGWIAGPQTVAIVQDEGAGVFADIVDKYAPDFIEIDAKYLDRLPDNPELPLIVRIASKDDLQLVNESSRNIAFLQTAEENIQWIKDTNARQKWIIEMSSPALLGEVLSIGKVAGISLRGSDETRPGFKEYDQLADILEILDED